MKTFISLTVLLFLFSLAYSQDIIVKKNGEKLNCKIQKEDSTKVYISILKYGKPVQTHISKNEIDTVILKPAIANIIDFATLGLGIGQDNGGFGANLTVYPHRNIGVFAGVGYAMADFGYNVGFKVRAISETNFRRGSVYGLAMYGYNAGIVIADGKEFNKLFYGPTIGMGIDYKYRPDQPFYWSVGVNIPFRGTKVQDYIEDLEKNHNIKMTTNLLPVTFSFGVKFIL
ncbi:MAG: hypothetical protein HC830_06910 [Bacteroidetes bacterium]|nr:hypothetical protein [Bacteroidota bacterium]